MIGLKEHYSIMGRSGKKMRKIISSQVDELTAKIRGDLTSLEQSHVQLQQSHRELNQEHQDFIDSLFYAGVIQSAIMPKKRHLVRAFENVGVLYMPKHIVSGDFYWSANVDACSYIALGDCTGHGIPGAMLSVLGSSLLNYAVLNKGLIQPSAVLCELDKRFIESFQLSDADDVSNDWLDLAFCLYNKETMVMEYAGARLSLFLVREGKLIEHKGDRFPIGGWQIEQNRTYQTHQIQIQKGDTVVLSSDGFADQHGGEMRKKFKKARFKDLIRTMGHYSAQEQTQILRKEILDWKQNTAQTDDITVITLKF